MNNNAVFNNNTNALISPFKEFKFFNSFSLSMEIQCRIMRLELPSDMSKPTDIFVSAFIVCNQMIMAEFPASTTYSNFDNESKENVIKWDYTLNFPIKIRDLSEDALLVLTVFTAGKKVFGGCSMRLFDDTHCLRMGRQKLLFYLDSRGDPSAVYELNSTRGEVYEEVFAACDYRFAAEKKLERFKIAAAHEGSWRGDWLDRFTAGRLMQCMQSGDCAEGHSEEKNDSRAEEGTKQANGEEEKLQRLAAAASEHYQEPLQQEMARYAFLVLELPSLPVQVIHEEKQYTSVTPHVPPMGQLDLAPYMLDGGADAGDVDSDAIIEFNLAGRPFNASVLTVVPDWDMGQTNLSEDLNRKLNFNARRGNTLLDASVKPNLSERDRLERVVQAVVGSLTSDEMDLLYKFRYSLTENKKALNKFLLAVNWDEEGEVNELPVLLALWKQKAPIDVEDAIKLLGKEKSYEHRFVREFAVEVLRSASDAELLTFLLQLVQALRYEPFVASSSSSSPSVRSSTAAAPAASTPHPEQQQGEPSSPSTNQERGSGTKFVKTRASSARAVEAGAEGLSPLANFLISRGCQSPQVANYLYWYLKVETEDAELTSSSHPKSSSNSGPGEDNYLFETVFDAFIVQLSTHSPEGNMLFKRLSALNEYIGQIAACQRDAREQGKRREGKEECLRRLLEQRNLQSVAACVGMDWVPMPLDPSIRITGLVANTAMMFASAVYPCVIEFHELVETSSEETDAANTTVISRPRTHKIMFKSGDDLRQDQLIMQMIALMDSLLKKVNLDLKLLTYGVLAVGQRDGIMEFVRNSSAISSVLKNFGSISEYLRHHCPDKTAPFEIAPKALDTFIRSCAGCCVVTFILGIGDRHLDNIMINTSGQMFHIDFGFIFGQDPKPLPSPFRFTRQMADAMGGEDSEHYAKFKSFCCQAYNWLRKSASLILNLLNLMGDAGIQDISKRSTLQKVLLRVEEKFRLDLNDEQAEQFFIGMINETLHAIAPRVMEQLHKIAVSLR